MFPKLWGLKGSVRRNKRVNNCWIRSKFLNWIWLLTVILKFLEFTWIYKRQTTLFFLAFHSDSATNLFLNVLEQVFKFCLHLLFSISQETYKICWLKFQFTDLWNLTQCRLRSLNWRKLENEAIFVMFCHLMDTNFALILCVGYWAART